jgi:hypothetical protein
VVSLSHPSCIKYDRKKYCTQGIEGDFGELWRVVRMPQMIMLLLYFFSSNFFYTSRFNGIQGTFFNSRTRGLNTMLYWVCTCDVISNTAYWSSMVPTTVLCLWTFGAG